MSKQEETGIEKGYFERPEVKKRLWILLCGLCALSIFLEFFLHRHGHFGEHSVDSIFGFYAILGFIACFLAALVSKFLGEFLTVNSDYYDDELH